MEHIIEPDRALTLSEWLAIGGAGFLLLALFIIGCWIVTSVKDRRRDPLDDPENWNWW